MASAKALSSRFNFAIPTTMPSRPTHTYQPAATGPFSSEFFNNLLRYCFGKVAARAADAFPDGNLFDQLLRGWIPNQT
jgi:hypothetical protein